VKVEWLARLARWAVAEIYGIEGNGGNAGLGRFGNCRRLRAASPPKNDKEMKRDKIRHLKAAMLVMFQGLTRLYMSNNI
jgi:hypothetical protein